MITTFKKCKIYTKPSLIPSNLLFDSLTKNYIFNLKRIIPNDNHLIPTTISLIHKNNIIATNDLKTKIAHLSDKFIQEFSNNNGFVFANVKYIQRYRRSKILYINENNEVEASKFKDIFTLQELMDIADAYPNDTQFGEHIRKELIK